MKKLYKSIFVLLVILLTGCSLKGSMAKPTNNDEEKEASQLQIDVENLISESNDLEKQAEDYQNAIDEVLNNINSEQTTETNE